MLEDNQIFEEATPQEAEDEISLDLPSFFVPDALREEVMAVADNFFSTGELPPQLLAGTTVNSADDYFFEQTPNGEPLFYTGVRGYGFQCYFYHWFYQSADLAISIVLPYPSVLADEEMRQSWQNEICHANDLAALLVGAVEKNPCFLENHPEARLRLTWDQSGLSYGFYQDGYQVDLPENPEMLVEILGNIFPNDLLQSMMIIRP